MNCDTDLEYRTLQHNPDSPSKSHYVSQASHGPLAAGKSVDPDQLFGEEEITFASKYLNLDYGTPPSASHAVEAETGPPSTSRDSFDVEMSWETEPTSLSFRDVTKSEIEARNSWPWGNYTYRPLAPPRFTDHEEYAREYEFVKIEEKLRVRLTELFAEEAICGRKEPKVEGRGERKTSEDVESGTSTPIIAFSQVIRGRTIYNP